MAHQELPHDFKEFLRLLTDHKVEYLLIGGYAVGYYGYPRTTADMDIWVALDEENAARLVDVLTEFGMASSEVTPSLFLEPGNIVRMGLPPVRIEVLNEIDGVDFTECENRAMNATLDSVPVRLISLRDLRANKRASGRYKDMDDLEHLPE
jgi:predicted nucleotidyltransferase